jgi:hypothetical protein
MSDYKALLQANALPQNWDYNALVHFARTMVPPAPALYMTRDDLLQLRVWSPSQVTTINVSTRFQTPDGQIIPGFRQVSGNTVGAASQIAPLEGVEGYLLSVTVETPNTPRGLCFVQVEVIRGQGSQDLTGGHVLVAGYPGSGQKIGFPQTPVSSPGTLPGCTVSLPQGNPGPGTDFTITVPAGENWIMRSLTLTFTTSAAVSNRVNALQAVDSGGNVMARSISPQTLPASVNSTLSWFNGGNGSTGGFASDLPWPYELRLQPGWKIQTFTVGIQGADQYSAVVLAVERFITS